MSLVVGSRQIADCRLQTVSLQPMVGGYEMIFALHLSVSSGEDELPRATIDGARIAVTPTHGSPQPLGFARPEQPTNIICKPHASTERPSLHLYLQPTQIAALETLRDKGDLTFDLSLSGSATDRHGPQYLGGNYPLRVPRSEWLQMLGNAGARNVLLLEVPLSVGRESEDQTKLVSQLLQAEQRFRDGDYHGCINSCRTAIEEIAHHIYGKSGLTAALKPLASSQREDMTKSERLKALYAVLRHYTHQAHHGPSEGGEVSYTRPEAQFVLSLTAAALAHALEQH